MIKFDFVNKLFLGDCINVLKQFPSESIDCVVTDPPYGIGFMGKEWDLALPPKEAFAQVHRVLKPGALAFVMSSPRQDVLWRMLSMLEACGFELRQSFVSWIYKTGFPKAMDVSLAIDKKFIREEFVREYGRKPTREELKELIKEKQKIVGKYKPPQMKKDWNLKQSKDETTKGSGGAFTSSKRRTLDITEPASDLAKKWNGWKSITGLKPALECVLMVNKPRSKRTIVDNVLKHGVGAINVDACRIPFRTEQDRDSYRNEGRGYASIDEKNAEQGYRPEQYYADQKKFISEVPKGRFPANLLVSDGALDTGKISHSHDHFSYAWKKNPYGGGWKAHPENGFYRGDVGDQSRYFDLDAWAQHHGLLDVPKASKREREMGLDGFEEKNMRYQDGRGQSLECFEMEGCGRKTKTKAKNVHPTVKPVKLMAYLIELGCPPDGVVLDPFVGSGTTCLAAKRLERKWCGIEINEEYMRIACARMGIPNEEAVVVESNVTTKRTPKQAETTKKKTIQCGYKGKCNYRQLDGSCRYKRHCKDRMFD